MVPSSNLSLVSPSHAAPVPHPQTNWNRAAEIFLHLITKFCFFFKIKIALKVSIVSRSSSSSTFIHGFSIGATPLMKRALYNLLMVNLMSEQICHILYFKTYARKGKKKVTHKEETEPVSLNFPLFSSQNDKELKFKFV